MSTNAPLMELRNVDVVFPTTKGPIKAVDNLSMTLQPGRVTCLVGESGSGKTTTARLAAWLNTPSAGSVEYLGVDVSTLTGKQFMEFRRSVQYIHQDPYASLNPTRSVQSTITAGAKAHGLLKGKSEERFAEEMLERVDLFPTSQFLNKYPHQLSGGQRQRVSVARALSVEPKLIIADEATSMLDVSIRSSMLKLMANLRDELGVGFLFITHDLALAQHFAWDGDLMIMYLGKLVDFGPTADVIGRSAHPYTRALLDAAPRPDPRSIREQSGIVLTSDQTPGLLEIPTGCPFHTRCPMSVTGLCDTVVPPFGELQAGHFVACHRTESIDAEMPSPRIDLVRITDPVETFAGAATA